MLINLIALLITDVFKVQRTFPASLIYLFQSFDLQGGINRYVKRLIKCYFVFGKMAAASLLEFISANPNVSGSIIGGCNTFSFDFINNFNDDKELLIAFDVIHNLQLLLRNMKVRHLLITA